MFSLVLVSGNSDFGYLMSLSAWYTKEVDLEPVLSVVRLDHFFLKVSIKRHDLCNVYISLR